MCHYFNLTRLNILLNAIVSFFKIGYIDIVSVFKIHIGTSVSKSKCIYPFLKSDTIAIHILILKSGKTT